jgi:hypothetical protein
LNFSWQIIETYKLDFIKIRPVGAELFHADRRTDMKKVVVAFRNSANAPKNVVYFNWTNHFLIKNVVSWVLTPVSSAGTNVPGEYVAYICRAAGLVPRFISLNWFYNVAGGENVSLKVGIHLHEINEYLKRARRKQHILPKCQRWPVILNGVKIQKTAVWKILAVKTWKFVKYFSEIFMFLKTE